MFRFFPGVVKFDIGARAGFAIRARATTKGKAETGYRRSALGNFRRNFHAVE